MIRNIFSKSASFLLWLFNLLFRFNCFSFLSFIFYFLCLKHSNMKIPQKKEEKEKKRCISLHWNTFWEKLPHIVSIIDTTLILFNWIINQHREEKRRLTEELQLLLSEIYKHQRELSVLHLTWRFSEIKLWWSAILGACLDSGGVLGSNTDSQENNIVNTFYRCCLQDDERGLLIAVWALFKPEINGRWAPYPNGRVVELVWILADRYQLLSGNKQSSGNFFARGDTWFYGAVY